MRKHAFLVLSVLAIISTLSGCGGPTTMTTTQSDFSTASNSATLDKVGNTIMTACAFKGWSPQAAGPGQIIATRRYAGKLAKVSIGYTSSSFEIRYLDSDNLDYTGGSISSVYEEWVDELKSEIERRLSNL